MCPALAFPPQPDLGGTSPGAEALIRIHIRINPGPRQGGNRRGNLFKETLTELEF